MAVWRRRSRRDQASLEARIGHALTELRPLLQPQDLAVELVEFIQETGVLVLRFRGDCPDCQMPASTLRQGVEARLRMMVPEIREVQAV